MDEIITNIGTITMRKQKEILQELSMTEIALTEMRTSGVKDNETSFHDGWKQALIWVLSTTDEEGEA